MALSDNNIGIRPTILGIKRPYGTSLKENGFYNKSTDQVLEILWKLYMTGVEADIHHTARRIRRAIPYNNVWYADFLFDKLEKGLY